MSPKYPGSFFDATFGTILTGGTDPFVESQTMRSDKTCYLNQHMSLLRKQRCSFCQCSGPNFTACMTGCGACQSFNSIRTIWVPVLPTVVLFDVL